MAESVSPANPPNMDSSTDVEHLDSRVEQVISNVRGIERQFFRFLQQEYVGVDKWAGSYWQLCGPASIAMSRIIAHRLGVPIGRDRVDEHIEVHTGIYDPISQPDHEQKIEPHVYTLYFLPNDKVLYIDPIYLLHMQNYDPSQNGGFSGVTLIEEFDRDTFLQQLAEKHNIYPFQPDYPGWAGSPEDIIERGIQFQDGEAALNDERATMRHFVFDSGRTSIDVNSNWFPASQVIRMVEPAWKVDSEAASRQLELYHQSFQPPQE